MSLFALASILISLAAVSSYINYRYIKLPTTVGVMLVSLVGSLVLIIAGPYAEGFRASAAALVGRIDFDKALLHGMLAFLLFAGAIHVKLDDLRREWQTVLSLAVVGTLASTFIVGGLTWLVLGWLGFGIPLMHAMLFGALISATDPIAVLGIMKSVGAPKRLETQMAGESLFNDGIGVVIFVVLVELSGISGMNSGEVVGTGVGVGGVGGGGAHAIGVGTVAMLLLKEVGGAIAMGLAVGMLVYRMLKRVDNYHVEVLLTLALAMGLYALADGLHLSAPIAVVIAGLFIGNQGRTLAMSDTTREHVDMFWELIDEILNVILFLLIGLELLVLPIEGRWLTAGMIAIPIVLLARFVSVAGIILPLRLVGSRSPGTRGTRRERGVIRILTWGGLRGGISVAMALSLPAGDSRSLLLTLTYVVVVFSILVQGLTVGRLIRSVATGPDSDRPAPAK